MSERRQSATYLALGLTIALFAGSSVLSFSRIERQSDELFVEQSDLLWLATSMELEFLRLIAAMKHYQLEPGRTSREQALHRLDLMWSRLPVLLEGNEAAPLRQLERFTPVINGTRKALERADAVFEEPRFERTTMDALMETLDAVRAKIHEFIITAYLFDEGRLDNRQDRLRTLQHGLYGSLLAMLLSGALLVFFLFRQIRSGRDLLQSATQSRRVAETQSRAQKQEMAERLHAEDRLRYSEIRFKDFAETAADWFWETDSDGRFNYLSDRFQEVMGLPAESMLGRGFAELLRGQADADWLARYAAALDGVRTFEDFKIEWRRPDGERRHLSISGRPALDVANRLEGYRGIARDITDTEQLARQMAYQATHDALTGLLNRREFERRVERVLSTCREQGNAHALCYLDLDQFKVVNDTCGHLAGDELLKQLSIVLADTVRKRDSVSRLGGDEFGVLIEHCTLEQAQMVAGSLRQAVEEFRFAFGERSFSLSVSIGLVQVDEHSESLSALLAAADGACYAAKDLGRNQIHVHRDDDHQLARRRGEMQSLSHIQRALDTDRFELLAQDIEPLSAGSSRGHFEVLLRMLGESGERVRPGAFLPAAERYHLSPRLDRWVIRQTLEWLAEWRNYLDDGGHCFVNLSGLSLGDGPMLDYIVKQFARTEVPCERVCFEVTETAAISNISNASRFFRELRERGVRFALDDFGSGLSSFGYLRTLPVDFIKIDGLFVKDVVDDPVDRAMVRSINEIGQLMGKKTVAEFVEDKRILATLRELGVDYAQGYHCGMPQPLSARVPTGLRGIKGSLIK